MRRALIVVFVLSGCIAAPIAVSPTPTVVTPEATAPQAGHTAAERTECARAVLTSFIDAFNRGDRVALAAFFPAPGGSRDFQWFTTPETPAYGPALAELPAYLAALHVEGQRWRLVSVTSGDGPSWHGGVDFAMRIERTWSDRAATTNVGKGALDCGARTIFVFSLGSE